MFANVPLMDPKDERADKGEFNQKNCIGTVSSKTTGGLISVHSFSLNLIYRSSYSVYQSAVRSTLEQTLNLQSPK